MERWCRKKQNEKSYWEKGIVVAKREDQTRAKSDGGGKSQKHALESANQKRGEKEKEYCR